MNGNYECSAPIKIKALSYVFIPSLVTNFRQPHLKMLVRGGDLPLVEEPGNRTLVCMFSPHPKNVSNGICYCYLSHHDDP